MILSFYYQLDGTSFEKARWKSQTLAAIPLFWHTEILHTLGRKGWRCSCGYCSLTQVRRRNPPPPSPSLSGIRDRERETNRTQKRKGGGRLTVPLKPHFSCTASRDEVVGLLFFLLLWSLYDDLRRFNWLVIEQHSPAVTHRATRTKPSLILPIV